MKAPRLENEAAQLEALHQYQILEADTEVVLNDLIDLAAYTCGTPIALVRFLGAERLWLRSQVGQEVAALRDSTFCDLTILQSDILIIPDTRADERVASSSLVAAVPSLRFYAGVPLVTPEGQVLGTLCVFDYVPRELNPNQIKALLTLGRQVMVQLELRRHSAQIGSHADRQIVERMKDEFISLVSHELRTPLTSIHGSLAMLASGLLSAEPEMGRRLLQIAVESTERLARLINDILDIERIESGKITIARQACETADLMTQAVGMMQPVAEKAEVTLSVEPITTRLWVEPEQIIQILTNLLSNAIKFSPAGSSVWLVAECQEEQILFQVKDRGRGIPTEKLETIFERFRQVDTSDSRNYGGTGLGLAICHSIVQQHGGRIWAESILGEGSTFSFTLPNHADQ